MLHLQIDGGGVEGSIFRGRDESQGGGGVEEKEEEEEGGEEGCWIQHEATDKCIPKSIYYSCLCDA